MAALAELDVLLALGPAYGPVCGACHGEGTVIQLTKATADGPVSGYVRHCALCRGAGRTAWPWP